MKLPFISFISFIIPRLPTCIIKLQQLHLNIRIFKYTNWYFTGNCFPWPALHIFECRYRTSMHKLPQHPQKSHMSKGMAGIMSTNLEIHRPTAIPQGAPQFFRPGSCEADGSQVPYIWVNYNISLT